MMGGVIVVLVTDGHETCDGDPETEIRKLQAAGLQVSLNIVGFAIDDDTLAAQFTDWALAGGGRYFAAYDADDLNDAVRQALATSFSVYDEAGVAIARGTAGGEPLELEQGVYRVIVESAPQRTLDEVEILGGQTTELEL